MKNFLKGKLATVLILIATVILAGVAIFTAIRLYQLRQQAVAPNVPSSFPRADDGETAQPTATPIVCSITFKLTSNEITPTPTATATPCSTCATATPTVTPTPTTPPTGTPNSCGGTCGSNQNCNSDMICYQGFCRNPDCVTSTSCSCAGAPVPTPTAPILPNAGIGLPTILTLGVGAILVITSLALIL